jgi:hypothetical protein
LTTPLDGNAIGGLLLEVFGVEMTTAGCVCASCGMHGVLAGCEVYLIAPGTVVRCRACQAVLMVFVEVHGVTCVDCMGLRDLDPGSRATPVPL